MAASQSQHRCVFVGNIPYDATEEQLKEICEEVGPVVSFRLVIDRETGKPKGYGFCEYKDEETALSARRNLQGYEINGRQLRVDFAENDKNSDRNREQGRGGPGMTTNVDQQKQFGGSAVLGNSTLHQPVGISVAMAAAAIMAQTLGAAQTGAASNQIGALPALGSDPLTLHLAKMSRTQLNEIISELKALSMQNKEQARQLLLACPNLPKAIFQAQLMLGMVPQQMLQMPNIRQASASSVLPPLHDGVRVQHSAPQSLPGLPPVPQNRQYNLLTQAQEAPVSGGHPSSVLHNQHNTIPQFSMQPQIQIPPIAQNKVLQQGQLPLQSGNATLPSMRPQHQGSFSFRPQVPVTTSTSLKQQVQPPLLQHPLKVAASSSLVYSQPQLTRPPLLDQGFQHGSSLLPGVPDNISRDPRRQVTSSIISDSLETTNHSSKLMRSHDGRMFSSVADKNVAISGSGQSQTFGTSLNHIARVEEASVSEKQVTQLQLPPEVESALLQQVMNLTPEQLSSLPPDQQQQVIQLQQRLRQAT